jgi:hypothetical protein
MEATARAGMLGLTAPAGLNSICLNPAGGSAIPGDECEAAAGPEEATRNQGLHGCRSPG